MKQIKKSLEYVKYLSKNHASKNTPKSHSFAIMRFIYRKDSKQQNIMGSTGSCIKQAEKQSLSNISSNKITFNFVMQPEVKPASDILFSILCCGKILSIVQLVQYYKAFIYTPAIWQKS